MNTVIATARQSNCAESYDEDDSFHKEIETQNHFYGEGTVTAIVWSTADQKLRTRSGMVISQDGDLQISKRFKVEYTPDSYLLKFLGKIKPVQSDYFAE